MPDRNIREFEKLVLNKYNIYNSLFLTLPYSNLKSIGHLIPLLESEALKGLKAGEAPKDILKAFFTKHTELVDEEEQIAFMFRVVQYVERQVVLFDSVEDAAFPDLSKYGESVTLKELLHRAESEGRREIVIERLAEFSALIVLTAHPTQFYPPEVLDIMAKLRKYIHENDIEAIDKSLQQLGMTSFINMQKPTPIEEARNIMYFMRNIYYDALAEYVQSVKYLTHDEGFDNSQLIRLGFWPGGDRDGNPFVTAESSLAVADELRTTLMKCYYRDAKKLHSMLTFREVKPRISALRRELYQAMFDPEHKVEYGYLLRQVREIREILIEKYNGLYLEELDDLILKLKIFRTHFAALDIRQNHRVHKALIGRIFRQKKWINKDLDELGSSSIEEKLIYGDLWLDGKLIDDSIEKDVIESMKAIRKIQERNGEEACHRYIISNSEDNLSVLMVYALARNFVWGDERVPLDIIPLFESMAAMESSVQILESLFKIPQYREHIRQRGDKQVIMLGYSDGTKDGGYLQANWSIFKTKERLSQICADHAVKAVFFDGRGGPPARGGGKTHRFYSALSPEIARHEIELTVQGQTISSKYGTAEHFSYNSEQLLAAVLDHELGKRKTISSENRKLFDRLTDSSHRKYIALREHPKFIPYLERKSTLKYYGQTKIGSRPGRRGETTELTLDDLRAIPFVSSWNLLKQNVPGYFGIGTALKELEEEGRMEDLKALFHNVPFFKALILNSMMALSKCNFDLTAYLDEDEEFGAFWQLLHDEYKLSKEMVLKVSAYKILMQEEPLSRQSIAVREHIILPLLIIQQTALQRLEEGNGHRELYEKLVRRCLYGNINASRNSA